jgi:hypothetical protein
MKKTIKPTAIMLITAIMVVIIAGCNNEPDNNEPAATETAAKPAAAPEGGEVADNTPITLTSETAGAVIYYTQDGTEPGTASTLYSDTNKPLITTGKLTLKAIAVKDGMNNSAVLTVVYTIEADKREPVIISADASPASLTLPGAATSVTLNCTAANADDTAVKSIEWAVKSSPAGAAPVISGSTASGLDVAGVYVFEVTVKSANDIPKTQEVTVKANLDATVEFPTITSEATIDFSPSTTLPKGVTYTVTDNSTPPKVWNSAAPESFNGQITAADYYESVNSDITFTQTFYLHGVKITSASNERTVVANVFTFGVTEFGTISSDSGSVTLKYNP